MYRVFIMGCSGSVAESAIFSRREIIGQFQVPIEL